MKNRKSLIFAALALGFIGGAMAVTEVLPTRSALAVPPGVIDDHWRFHDGRWSYWNQADGLWYYTDGVHWFYHNGKIWAPYHFDRGFGRKFERGAYKVPGEGVHYTVPGHKIYVP